MSTLTFNLIAAGISISILYGLSLMSQVKTSVRGNLICTAAMLLGMAVTIINDNALTSPVVWLSIAIGTGIGLFLSNKVKMIQMPQLVALLNGLGGGAAAIVGLLVLMDSGAETVFDRASAGLALLTGMMTLAGALVAAGKLHQVLPQKPVVLPNHNALVNFIIGGMFVSTAILAFTTQQEPLAATAAVFIFGTLFGLVFTIRVGGADMPITISLLNSLAGVSGAIAGFAIADPLLVAIGGIVGSAGLLLTRIMCRAMNRKLLDILVGGAKKIAPPRQKTVSAPSAAAKTAAPKESRAESQDERIAKLLHAAKKVIIVPGYGMAMAQAQYKVKQLADVLEKNGAEVKYAIHPVAGRMPGHMNVLLAEANVDYEQLIEMDAANPMFPTADLVIIVGANDVVNPAAIEAEGTPIYGMPILRADEAKNVIICNYDTKPGYAGVDNPLYKKAGVEMMLGDASKTMDSLIGWAMDDKAGQSATEVSEENTAAVLLGKAKKVLIVPGYGMAMAQAQHKVKQLADVLENNGADVKYAIHPVAGRMPGHMNVLLAEANVDYEQLIEMDTANPMFPGTDLVIIVGANDVVNPAAIEAEGTPIYGMPILRADEAKNVIICNYDTKPGYAGVDNPLYKKDGVLMMLGDAAKTMDTLIGYAMNPQLTAAPQKERSSAAGAAGLLAKAKKVLIVPGYGMAMAQAQYKVKQLADILEGKGADVKYAIHPVAGRMPGHMNVLLAEANVDYEQLIEMDTANPLFPGADLVIIVGANDVVNPAAIEAEGTPIYGMPILRADEAKNVIICNYDTKPGYAGVDNPLYEKAGVILMLGDAAKTMDTLIEAALNPGQVEEAILGPEGPDQQAETLFAAAKKVLIVPGYGMAMAQAQYKVKQLADILETKGADVKYAIHPVAGRMPGHMNVLLAEANVDYEQLIEMDAANPLFPGADLVIIVGANDVVNPAAIEAEGTPIYGMPILRADEAKNVIICNYDTKPGYAGVDNPLYEKAGVILMLGDASTSLDVLIGHAMKAGSPKSEAAAPTKGPDPAALLHKAKKVLIVPGYGMAMAQAQYKVKQLADMLEANGADVKYAIHPVAGRMPGHMNVLLAEANVDYEQLIEMDAANPMFPGSDLVIIVGANDVVNPAAIEAEGTPIYGMPILRADEAKNVIICNYDTKPGYAGVDNPLYNKDGVLMMLGDAAKTMDTLIGLMSKK